jgi:GntR family transcriptional regulator, transcriptional repressor for pyruvate dehydrogenase complex
LPHKAVLQHFEPIRREKPSMLIVRQLRALIAKGTLAPGSLLPPERVLAEQFGVSRSQVREALQRLDFFGVVQTFPQSGTRVASLGTDALERLIANVLDLDKSDIRALSETRLALEVDAARHAARRAEPEDLARLAEIQDNFAAEVAAGRSGIDDDMAFHLAIADAAKNSLTSALIGMIAPDIIVKAANDFKTCSASRTRVALREHAAILAAIRAHAPDEAASAMAEHLKMAGRQFSPNAKTPP